MADIKGNNIGAPITPFTTEDIYNTHFAKYGKGSLHNPATLAERDATLESRREWGMEANLPSGTKYVLVKGLVDTNIMNNANWKLVVAGEYDDTELQARTAQNEADIVDVENAVLAVETEVERRVLKVVGKQLSDQNYTLEEKQKLAALGADSSLFKGTYNPATVYAQGEFVVERNSLYKSLYDNNVYKVDVADGTGTLWWEPVIDSLNYAIMFADNGTIKHETSDGQQQTITKADLQLNNVDNTRDINKPISNATQAALNNKVDKVAGKQLSDENFTSAEKTKLAGLENSTATSYDDTAIKNRVSTVETAVVNKVDKVTGKQLTDVNFSQLDKTKLDSLQNTPTYNDAALKSRVTSVENTLLDKVDKVAGKQLSTEDFTTAYRTKLDSLQNNTATSYDDTAIKERVSATETRLTAAEAAVATKVDKVFGKQLSAEDFTSALKTKLETLTQGETVTSFQRQGNSLVLTTSSGTKTVDLTDLINAGGTTTVVTSEIQTLQGTLDASYSGVLPANSAQILSLVVANGYALMSSEYTTDLVAGTFTINAATATSLSALVAGDAYEVVVQLTSTTDGGTGTGGTSSSSQGLSVLAVATVTNSGLLGGGFATVPLSTVVTDIRPTGTTGGWDTATYEYVAPVAGTYFITTKMRTNDGNAPAGRSYGQGAGTTNSDGPWFQWFYSNGVREGSLNTRVMELTAGQRVRMYALLDGFNAGVSAEMTVSLFRSTQPITTGGGGNSTTPTASDNKTLEFVFNGGFANDFTTMIGSNQAAEYTSQQLSNVATVTYTINTSAVNIPFSLLAGDTLKVTITRTDTSAGAIVSIAN
ncbi:hypothetical protein [Hymenobacter sublimis]|uniref:Uncharacterized protein n=1 Tax=Hymenobacter sublimis TaxID=2933777 RepID=A0ABY4JGS8_9BACT|nr:hypothetical protein [Hymenobacter sublimis]UPL50534.1 hypothetical protein MWH26_06405 [Hymenobacter sublimis]